MTVTVEIDNITKNGDYRFAPLQRTLRGRLDFNRDSRPDVRVKGDKLGAIPGMRVTIKDNTARIEEPLRDDENTALREKIEALGYKIPANDTFEGIDANSWLFWLKRAVEGGHARIISGKFPAVDAAAARKEYVLSEPQSSTDRLATALEKQTEMLAAVLEKLSK